MAREAAQQVAGTVSFVLPVQLFGVVEVRRLTRELAALNEYMRQAGLREAGAQQDTLPRVSRLLDATAAENNLNLLLPDDRKTLNKDLKLVLEKAPTVHMSFASDPSAAFLEKIVSWLRGNVHPLMLIRLGLQPSIAAGCVIRTPNRAFDFSLRHRFTEERELLLYSLEMPANSSGSDAHAESASDVSGSAAGQAPAAGRVA